MVLGNSYSHSLRIEGLSSLLVALGLKVYFELGFYSGRQC